MIGYSLLERFVFNGTGRFNRIGFKNGFSRTRTGFHRTGEVGDTGFLVSKDLDQLLSGRLVLVTPLAGSGYWIGLDLDFGFRGYRISINF